MKYARWVRRAGLPGVAALAAAAVALGSSGAQASLVPTTLSSSGITFATQAVAGSSGGGSVTIGIAPANFQGAAIVYTNVCGAVAAATTANVTFTLPAGVTFGAPSPTAAGDGAVFGPAAPSATTGGTGSNFVTFTFSAATCAAIGNVGTVTLSAFSLVGASQLASTTIAGQFQMTATTSAGTAALTAAIGDTAGAKNSLAQSASALTFGALAPTTGTPAIDITSPGGFGSKFIQAGVDSTVGDAGALTTTANATLATAADSAAFAPPTTTNVLITGNFSNSTLVLLAGASVQALTCGSAPSGTTGTVVGNIATFSNVTIGAGTKNYEVCVVSVATAGKNLIGAQTAGLPIALTAAGATGGGALIGYTYNGSVQQILYSGNFNTTGYPLVERLTNNTSSAVSPTVLVVPDSGTAGNTTLAAIPAGANEVLLASAIVTASGAVPDTTGRVTLIYLTPGSVCVNNGGGPACSVSVSQFVLNPSGVISTWGSGAAP